MPHRKRYLFVCTNRREDGNPKGSCAQKGSEVVIKRLKEELLKLGVHKEVRACTASCLDLCELGISIVEEPRHVVYGHVTLEDVPELARAFAEDRVLDRLVLDDVAAAEMAAKPEPAKPPGTLGTTDVSGAAGTKA